MKILVYGAGVIGSYLIHVLMRAGNHVTVVSPSKWGLVLKEQGLLLYHRLQKKWTRDYPEIIFQPDKQTHYDMVFSIMQEQQQMAVLEDLAGVNTDLIILVGNNLNAGKMEKIILTADGGKRVLFGFQPTGGVRRQDHVVCVHWGKGSMTIGGLHAYPTWQDRQLLLQAFHNSGYHLEWMDDMNGWLWSHMAFILPIVYICYFYHCNLRLINRSDLEDMLHAASEGFAFLKHTDITIRPQGIDVRWHKEMKSQILKILLLIMAKTTWGELAASDHCRNAVTEMQILDTNFAKMRCQYLSFKMPAWEKLRSRMPSWQEIQKTYNKKA